MRTECWGEVLEKKQGSAQRANNEKAGNSKQGLNEGRLRPALRISKRFFPPLLPASCFLAVSVHRPQRPRHGRTNPLVAISQRADERGAQRRILAEPQADRRQLPHLRILVAQGGKEFSARAWQCTSAQQARRHT